MRRRIKRKVRKKRRVLDERRRIGIQRVRSRDDNAARGRQGVGDDVTSEQGRNRWPLPGVCFESSSGSGSDVWRFRSPLLRSEAYRDAAKREASLLEDIWCHLDEITQRANRIKGEGVVLCYVTRGRLAEITSRVLFGAKKKS